MIREMDGRPALRIRCAASLLLGLLLSIVGVQPLWARIVVVQKDLVNVRQGASTSSAVLGKVDKGAVFGWAGASADWTRIHMADGKQGYVRNDLLQGFDEIVVAGSGVRIRQSPSLQGAVIGSARNGDRLAVTGYRDGWYAVEYERAAGWISAAYAKLGASVALPTAAAAQLPQADWQAPAIQETSGSAAAGAAEPEQHNFDSVTVSSSVLQGPLSGKVVTLDPGHGLRSDDGRLDPGAQSALLGLQEKDVNLDVALKLKAILENAGATVWMTHMESTSLSLSGRAAVANRNASHIFVSIHTNASENTALNGHSVYFHAPVTDSRLGNQRPLRQALAKYVQEAMTRTVGRADLGVKESNFVVLRETHCPSILVETAFLSYAEEELLLAQGVFRQRLADAIALGILRFFGVTAH